MRYRPMNKRYVAFSMEELSAVEFNNAIEKAHSIDE